MTVFSLVVLAYVLEEKYVVKYSQSGISITYRKSRITLGHSPSIRITVKNITGDIICGDISASLYIWLPNGTITPIGFYSGSCGRVNIDHDDVAKMYRVWYDHYRDLGVDPHNYSLGMISFFGIKNKKGDLYLIIKSIPLNPGYIVDGYSAEACVVGKPIKLRASSSSLSNVTSQIGSKSMIRMKFVSSDEFSSGVIFHHINEYNLFAILDAVYFQGYGVPVPLILVNLWGSDINKIGAITLSSTFIAKSAKDLKTYINMVAEVKDIQTNEISYEIPGAIWSQEDNLIWDTDYIFAPGIDFDPDKWHIFALGFYADVAVARYKILYSKCGFALSCPEVYPIATVNITLARPANGTLTQDNAWLDTEIDPWYRYSHGYCNASNVYDCAEGWLGRFYCIMWNYFNNNWNRKYIYTDLLSVFSHSLVREANSDTTIGMGIGVLASLFAQRYSNYESVKDFVKAFARILSVSITMGTKSFSLTLSKTALRFNSTTSIKWLYIRSPYIHIYRGGVTKYCIPSLYLDIYLEKGKYEKELISTHV